MHRSPPLICCAVCFSALLCCAGSRGRHATIHKRLPDLLQKAVLNSECSFGKEHKLLETLLQVSADKQREQHETIVSLQAKVNALQQQVVELQEAAAQQVQEAAAQRAQLQQKVDQLQATLMAALKRLEGKSGPADGCDLCHCRRCCCSPGVIM